MQCCAGPAEIEIYLAERINHDLEELGVLYLRSPLPPAVLFAEKKEQLPGMFAVAETDSALGFAKTLPSLRYRSLRRT